MVRLPAHRNHYLYLIRISRHSTRNCKSIIFFRIPFPVPGL